MGCLSRRSHWEQDMSEQQTPELPDHIPIPDTAEDIVLTIQLALARGYTPAEILDENSPICDRLRGFKSTQKTAKATGSTQP